MSDIHDFAARGKERIRAMPGKIVWMIPSQHKTDHFQFWVLNTLECLVNNIAKRMRKIEKTLTASEKQSR